jgi:hypothetical protein
MRDLSQQSETREIDQRRLLARRSSEPHWGCQKGPALKRVRLPYVGNQYGLSGSGVGRDGCRCATVGRGPAGGYRLAQLRMRDRRSTGTKTPEDEVEDNDYI